ncbi:MAG: hypothetical protein HZB55_00330 [Deltaproteobacteria bacterium]|nr:hypothetical protein [Deltaproteobacteria bacterium]
MRRAARWSLAVLILLCAVRPSPAGDDAEERGRDGVCGEIVSACSSAPVFILGERHREASSHALFLEVVNAFVARGERVLVGLEIGSDRQPYLDAAIRGTGSPDAVARPPIDSPSYRELVHALGGLARAPDSRVTVRAIDAPVGSSSDRDEEMAATVGAALRSGSCDRVVALVGNFHALKEVPAATGATDPRKRLAGLLSDRGVKVVSLVQKFPGPCAGRANATLFAAGDETTATMVHGLWGALKTNPSCVEPATHAAVDGVVAWTCGDEPPR